MIQIESLFEGVSAPRRINALTAVRTFIWRTYQHTKNNGFGFVMDAVLSPVMLLLIFTYLFGGAVAGSTKAYLPFLLPGILVLTVVPMTVYSGTTLCADIAKGLYNRFRTMSYWQPASVLGPLLTDGLRYVVASLVALGMGFLLGYRPDGGIVGVIAAVMFVVCFAFSVSWIFTMLGIMAKQPETVSGSSMLVIYPLLFASNILVDSATMPRWLQVIVEFNPISIATETVRGLMDGTANTSDLAAGIGVCTLLIVVFAPLTLYLYRTKNNR